MRFIRLLAALVLAVAASAAGAVSIVERSPFAQGHWWDPTRSGSGFELFNVGDQAMAIWYTYDESGAPVWYTAQGTLVEPNWPLLRHRWADGRHAGYDVVGTFRFTLRSPESAQVNFRLGGREGTWTIQPFTQSGVVNEVDHTGSYFDPANSGWGFTLTQQGDVLGGVLYTYDPSGAPLWYAGFDRGVSSTVNMISARGACPTCAYTPTTTQAAGRVTLDFRSERELVIGNQLTGAMAAGVNVDGARIVQLGRPASTRRADRELAAFAAEDSLREYLVAGMRNLPPIYSGIDFSPAPAAAATFSTTNVQEAGVDEADLVKTDGFTIYTFEGSPYNQASPAIRVARVGADGTTITVAGRVPIAGWSASSTVPNAGLYLHGDQLVSVTGTRAGGYAPVGIWGWASSWTNGSTHLQFFRTSPAGLPVSESHARIDGHIVSSRRVGNRLYLVTRFVPYIEGFVYGATSPALQAANDQRLAATPTSALLPAISIDGAASVPAIGAQGIMLPPLGTRPPTADIVTVHAIDIPTRRIVQTLSVLGSAETVYASPTNLYVATSRYQYRSSSGILLPEPPFYTTDVHQVRLGEASMELVGTGTVEGALGNDSDRAAFRFGEHEGRLRVVTSSAGMWSSTSRNRLTILQPSAIVPGLLKTVSILPNARRPEPLGKPGELLYGTRFVGDRLYAVTFRNIDPLYVVDLSNAEDPRIAGAVELPGFSEYLHPLENGLLLGFGKDAKSATVSGDGNFAWYQGLQLVVFDVSDAARPRVIRSVVLGKRGSQSALLLSHHALSTLRRAEGSLDIAFPARIHDGTVPLYGVGDSATYPYQESGLARFELRGSTPATAQLVQRPSLVTHTATQYGQGFFYDPASSGGRSVIFNGGVVYVGNGTFWRMDSAGGPAVGPF